MISPEELKTRLANLKNLDFATRLSKLTEASTKSAFAGKCHQDPQTHACSNCGACCQRVLPLSKEEISKLKALLKNNPLLRKYIVALNKGLPLRICPFMDFTQSVSKCMIYNASERPSICQLYTCNFEERQQNPPEDHYSTNGIQLYRTDVWYTLFQKATSAQNIAPFWSDMDLLSHFGFHLPSDTLSCPEQLPRYFQNFSWVNMMFKLLPQKDIPSAFLLGNCSDAQAKNHLIDVAESRR